MTIEQTPSASHGGEAHHSRAEDLRRSLTNLPNLLTMARVVAVPAVLVFIDNFSPTRSFIACLIYLGASITDFLDGYLARRRRQVSILGKFLDPLADKLIVTAVLVYLAALARCPPWLVVALLARELAMTGLRGIAASEGLVISASSSGKRKTALQMVGTCFLLVHFRYRLVWTSVVIDFHQVGIVVLYMSLVMSALSFLLYVRAFVRALYARPA